MPPKTRKNPTALLSLAEKKRASSKFLEALPLYLEAQKAADNDELRLNCTQSSADVYRMIGEFSKAAGCYKAASSLARRLGNEPRSIDCLVGLGLSLRASGDIKAAIEIFDGALTFYKNNADKHGYAFALWARAGALRIKGDLKGALVGFKKAKTIFASLGDASGAGYCLTGLGGASRVAGRYAESGGYYHQANKVFRGLKDAFGIAYSYCGMANSLRMRGRYKESLGYFSKAKTNYKKIGDIVSFAYTLWGEGSAYQMLGMNARALKDFREAITLFKKSKDRRGLVYCALTIGQAALGANHANGPAKGIKTVKAALRSAEALGLEVEAGYARRILASGAKLPVNLA